jgi:hypothetical protein
MIALRNQCQRHSLNLRLPCRFCNGYSQPGTNIDIAARDLGRAKEGVPAVASSTDNFHGVAATVRFGGVKRDRASLVAIWSICCPGCLVPTTFKIIRDLGERQREQRESCKAECSEHDRVWVDCRGTGGGAIPGDVEVSSVLI